MRILYTPEATINGFPTPVTLLPNHDNGIFFAYRQDIGPTTCKLVGMPGVTTAMLEALKADDDSRVREVITSDNTGFHSFVGAVIIGSNQGAVYVNHILEAPGTAVNPRF
ncbi:MAG: hypothetical protein ACYCPS_03995 [Candidatus Saccharimonadales bacterium]